jgi:tetratricopeptide (TPR) repeat protein
LRQPALLAIGSSLLVLGLPTSWIDFPISADVSGLQLGIHSEMVSANLFVWGSYGFLAVMLLGGIVIFSRRRPGLSAGLSSLLVIVGLMVPLHLTFASPTVLYRLIHEHGQYVNIVSFSETYLPINFGEQPGYQPELQLETVTDRLNTGWYFLGIGWYLFMIGGLILSLRAWSALSFRGFPRLFWILFPILALVVLMVFLFRPVTAELFRLRAMDNKAAGRLAPAIAEYRTVLARDSWHGLVPDISRDIGGLWASLGREQEPEYRLYRGLILERNDMLSEAIFEYRLAAAYPNLADLANHEISRLLVNQGLSRYEEGEVTSAVESWRLALETEPARLDVLFFLGRAYYVLGDYEKAIQTNTSLILRASSRRVLADLHSNLGDCYTKLQAYNEARRHYSFSQELDNDQNFRALISLVGI